MRLLLNGEPGDIKISCCDEEIKVFWSSRGADSCSLTVNGGEKSSDVKGEITVITDKEQKKKGAVVVTLTCKVNGRTATLTRKAYPQ